MQPLKTFWAQRCRVSGGKLRVSMTPWSWWKQGKACVPSRGFRLKVPWDRYGLIICTFLFSLPPILYYTLYMVIFKDRFSVNYTHFQHVCVAEMQQINNFIGLCQGFSASEHTNALI
ncbi:hypothetical protein XENOCAPTIV_027017 [Xenoophorus captivus]|uniref:Uncharacterized protein n=1 Tax=Xenoophorus captivus TaxID=1517983 RepID=A0ABV0R2F0_9TELE